MDQTALISAAVMLTVLAGGIVAMAGFRMSQALVMPLVAAIFLVMSAGTATAVITQSLSEFAAVALIFTAIAIPAHQLQRSHLFEQLGARLGGLIGRVGLGFPRLELLVLVGLALGLTWLAAALLHNITGIFVMTPILIAICMSYGVPSRWVLCGALVASNLGGFSLATADTPNIIESRTFGLAQMDFIREIMPLNLGVLALVALIVAGLTAHDMRIQGRTLSDAVKTRETVRWRRLAIETQLDMRLVLVGLGVLGGFILSQFIRRDLEVAAAALAIFIAVAGDHKEKRLESLFSLSPEVYGTLASVFIIAHCISHSLIGAMLEHMIRDSHGAIWAIAVSSYLGTSLTEAASWAQAAAPITYAVNGGHAAAWALGAGICAGSSSVLTAASAGIILWRESQRTPGHGVSFSSYLPFGVGVSLLMLGLYIIAIGLLYASGHAP